MNKSVSEIFSIMCELRSRIHTNFNTSKIRWIYISARNGNYKIIRNHYGKPCGYIIWARVVRETLIRLEKYDIYPIYEYEYDEGNICLILDVFLLHDRAYELKKFSRRIRLLAWKKNGKLSVYKRFINRFKSIKIKEKYLF